MQESKFDEFALRDALNRRRIKICDFAEQLGVSKPTLYRKMSGESDFTRTEIQKSCEILGEDVLRSVFFAINVTETQ